GTPFAPVYDNVNDALKDKSPLTIRILQGDVSKLWAKMERFDRLEILYLANNGMEHLPAGIARCQSLFAMAIRKNPLKTFPEELGFLPALLYLELSDTRISEIPESFSALDKLELFRIVNTQT